ncbi:MAG TPA: alpha/beta hydrolase-fold protein [Trebonia sp.]|nr:alpha/beta hydrolase-fold protein [Trebonia sp.]
MNPLDWPLIAGPLPAILRIGALLAVAWLVAGRNAPGRRFLRRGARGGSTGGAVSVRWLAICVPVIAIAAGGVVALLTWLTDNVWRPFPDLLPFTIVLWSWVALAGVLLALARQPLLRTWPRRAAAIAASVFVLVAAANQVNLAFQAYPSLRIALAPWLDPKPLFTKTVRATEVIAKPGQAVDSIWHPPPRMPKTGAVYRVNIPGVRSGFAARPGYLYLPPAYLATPRPQLPVLVLLSGQPGDSRNWLDAGQLQAMMDGFAARHGGLAPIVVMPDDLGSEFANPMCLNSRLGNVQTYLTVDVPNWITSHLQVRPPGQGWAVGGFSAGGTCAIQLATQAPRLYRVFVDVSGQDEPTLGSRRRTIGKAFGGDAAAFARVDPIVVLARTRFPRSAGVFVGGTNDRVYTPEQRIIYLAARHAGMNVSFMELPGGHDWRVWRGGLQQNVAWLAGQLGITGGAR